MRGNVRIEILEKDGTTRLLNISNLVVDISRVRITDAIMNGVMLANFSKIKFGLVTEILPAGNDDTDMQEGAIMSVLVDSQVLENNGISIKNISGTVTVSEEAFEYNELGLFQGDDMFSRVVLDETQSIPVDAQYTVYWTITF